MGTPIYFIPNKSKEKPGVLVHAINASIWETGAGGLLHCRLVGHSRTLFQEIKEGMHNFVLLPTQLLTVLPSASRLAEYQPHGLH